MKNEKQNIDRSIDRGTARSILERYYRHLREHNMDRLFWDVINQAVIALGGDGDKAIDHAEYEARYDRDGVSFREVAEAEIHWTERVPEIDERLPDALRMAVGEMERRGIL